jgi:hypothetical membrane protein
MSLPVRTLALAAAVVAHVPPVAFGALTPGYTHIGQYISELGAIDAPYGGVVSLGTFLPAGVLLVLTCLALLTRLPPTRAARVGMAMVALMGVSWIVAAFAIGYLGGGAGLLVVAGALRADCASATRVGVTAACGVVLTAGLFVMAAPEMASVRGAVQRAMELTASAWMLATAWAPPAAR